MEKVEQCFVFLSRNLLFFDLEIDEVVDNSPKEVKAVRHQKVVKEGIER